MRHKRDTSELTRVPLTQEMPNCLFCLIGRRCQKPEKKIEADCLSHVLLWDVVQSLESAGSTYTSLCFLIVSYINSIPSIVQWGVLQQASAFHSKPHWKALDHHFSWVCFPGSQMKVLFKSPLLGSKPGTIPATFALISVRFL